MQRASYDRRVPDRSSIVLESVEEAETCCSEGLSEFIAVYGVNSGRRSQCLDFFVCSNGSLASLRDMFRSACMW